ncbi:alpha-L-fucosidase [Fluviicola sp.]|uniref:alpha-L-fucosidase n=1 Tax=Fluviicola sp. TaxID=1917219 RepID=UPI00261C2736|nr:alpha-L-fucosidase [Fluviicola sp.]
MDLKAVFTIGISCLISLSSWTQVNGIHPVSNDYQKPTDPQVLKKLEQWQDQKFGVIIHWGLYAVPGIVESWSICSEDWITRDSTSNYDDYKKWYWGLSKELNPVKFNPERWADISKKAGMKYLVFTTKHHDGFCMFDTKQTDFKITAGPFASNPKSDVLKHVFDAYRKEGFMIGAYFSKPDWHNENYWWPLYATPNRNNNYDTRKHPWRWEQFQNFTYNQIQEIVTGYGGVDILWLDGGWVRPMNTIDDEVLSWGAPIPQWNQELNIGKIAGMARSHQPGMIVVDRTVQGPYENYQTPEHTIPEKRINNPWETCMPLCTNWGYVPNDEIKSTERVIRTLVEVVAKGGNLLLGVGPKADGTIPENVEQRLLEVGAWMDANKEAIYETRSLDHYREESVFFTHNPKKKKTYALVVVNESLKKNKIVSWSVNLPKKGTAMIYLPTGEKVNWKIANNQVHVQLPGSIVHSKSENPVWTFAFETE